MGSKKQLWLSAIVLVALTAGRACAQRDVTGPASAQLHLSAVTTVQHWLRLAYGALPMTRQPSDPGNGLSYTYELCYSDGTREIVIGEAQSFLPAPGKQLVSLQWDVVHLLSMGGRAPIENAHYSRILHKSLSQ
jgi:hypothetical protein